MNEHLEAFLRKYLGIRPPPGAVLVNAPWGAGKTFLVKRVLRDLGGSYIYVSVNGVTTYDELVRRSASPAQLLLKSLLCGEREFSG